MAAYENSQAENDQSDKEFYDVLIMCSESEIETARHLCERIRNLDLGQQTYPKVALYEDFSQLGETETGIIDCAIEQSTFRLFFRSEEFFKDEMRDFAASVALCHAIEAANKQEKATFIPVDVATKKRIPRRASVNHLKGITISYDGEFDEKPLKKLLLSKLSVRKAKEASAENKRVHEVMEAQERIVRNLTSLVEHSTQGQPNSSLKSAATGQSVERHSDPNHNPEINAVTTSLSFSTFDLTHNAERDETNSPDLSPQKTLCTYIPPSNNRLTSLKTSLSNEFSELNIVDQCEPNANCNDFSRKHIYNYHTDDHLNNDRLRSTAAEAFSDTQRQDMSAETKCSEHIYFGLHRQSPSGATAQNEISSSICHPDDVVDSIRTCNSPKKLPATNVSVSLEQSLSPHATDSGSIPIAGPDQVTSSTMHKAGQAFPDHGHPRPLFGYRPDFEMALQNLLSPSCGALDCASSGTASSLHSVPSQTEAPGSVSLKAQLPRRIAEGLVELVSRPCDMFPRPDSHLGKNGNCNVPTTCATNNAFLLQLPHPVRDGIDPINGDTTVSHLVSSHLDNLMTGSLLHNNHFVSPSTFTEVTDESSPSSLSSSSLVVDSPSLQLPQPTRDENDLIDFVSTVSQIMSTDNLTTSSALNHSPHLNDSSNCTTAFSDNFACHSMFAEIMNESSPSSLSSNSLSFGVRDESMFGTGSDRTTHGSLGNTPVEYESERPREEAPIVSFAICLSDQTESDGETVDIQEEKQRLQRT